MQLDCNCERSTALFCYARNPRPTLPQQWDLSVGNHFRKAVLMNVVNNGGRLFVDENGSGFMES